MCMCLFHSDRSMLLLIVRPILLVCWFTISLTAMSALHVPKVYYKTTVKRLKLMQLKILMCPELNEKIIH